MHELFLVVGATLAGAVQHQNKRVFIALTGRSDASVVVFGV